MHPSFRYGLLLAVCLLLQQWLYAQTAIHLHDSHYDHKIKSSELSWLLDTTGNFTFKEVSSSKATAFPATALPAAKNHWKLWTRFTLYNHTGRDQDLVLLLPKSGFANAYLLHSGDTQHLHTGSLLPLRQRALASSNTGFRIALPAEKPITVWLQLQSGYSIYRQPDYPVTLMPALTFAHTDGQRLLWQGLFLGIILVMVLYNTFIGFAVRDASYLFYVLSIAGLGSYFAYYYGFGIEYIWPDAPRWDTFCYLALVPFSGLMRLFFTRTYLHTRKLLPNVDFLIRLMAIILAVILLTGLYAYASGQDLIYPLLDLIGLTGTLTHLLMLAAGLIAYFGERYGPARHFIWANALLVAGAILFIGRELHLLPDNFWTRYLVQIGLLVQAVVFSLGLADRLNTMRTQLAQELIDREREKKAMIEAQRKELLLQVARQTKDLMEKNLQLERSFTQVKESEHKLAEMNEVKNKLFSVISHDLRNPLATMQSYLKLITEHHNKLSDAEKDELITRAQHALDNLNLLLFNLLQWSRAQMNQLQFCPEVLDAQVVISNAVSVLQLHAHLKEITLDVAVAPGACIYADKEMTEFIVRNLVSNAIKFSHPKSRVLISAREVGGVVEIAVEDKGIGMSLQQRERLLQQQTTLSRRGTAKEKGTGLGLMICKEFIGCNNGRLSIASAPGAGATFTFTLPKVAMHAPSLQPTTAEK